MAVFEIIKIRVEHDRDSSGITKVMLKDCSAEGEPVSNVIGWIENRQHSFFAAPPNGLRAEVEVVQSGAKKYLRSKANKTTKDNLLLLPPF